MGTRTLVIVSCVLVSFFAGTALLATPLAEGVDEGLPAAARAMLLEDAGDTETLQASLGGTRDFWQDLLYALLKTLVNYQANRQISDNLREADHLLAVHQLARAVEILHRTRNFAASLGGNYTQLSYRVGDVITDVRYGRIALARQRLQRLINNIPVVGTPPPGPGGLLPIDVNQRRYWIACNRETSSLIRYGNINGARINLNRTIDHIRYEGRPLPFNHDLIRRLNYVASQMHYHVNSYDVMRQLDDINRHIEWSLRRR